MKKSANILRLVFGIIAFCLVVQLVQQAAYCTNTSAVASRQTSKESYLTVYSSHIWGYALAPESSLSTSVYAFSSLDKSQFKVFFSTTKINELVLNALYVQYTFYVRNLLTCFRPTDIIFPFHYFW